MTISAEQIRHLAKLASLKTDPEQAGFYAVQLTRIMALVEQLNAIDTAGVAPLSHPQDAALRLRADTVTEPDRRAEFQAIAPDAEQGLYLVPRVLE